MPGGKIALQSSWDGLFLASFVPILKANSPNRRNRRGTMLFIFQRSNSCVTEAFGAVREESAGRIGIKEPLSSTISRRTLTVSRQHITVKRTTKPATSFPGRPWNTQRRHSNMRKKLTKISAGQSRERLLVARGIKSKRAERRRLVQVS
jgi:hypothetical protein